MLRDALDPLLRAGREWLRPRQGKRQGQEKGGAGRGRGRKIQRGPIIDKLI